MDGERDPFAVLEFGRFKVVPHRRELIADGKPVTLGGRAFDTLLALIDAGGSVIDKDLLMRRVGPDRIVHEINPQAQISALRNAVADDRDRIRTVARPGYQVTAEIRPSAASPTGKDGLALLGTCEHLSEAAARMAEAPVRATHTVCAIAASREPLRGAAEYVDRVPPLDVPDENSLDADDVLRHGAVRLFVA